jgi:cell division protein FtsZ
MEPEHGLVPAARWARPAAARTGATTGPLAPILVVGVGGAGVNAVSRLLDLDLPGIRCVAVDTSAQTLRRADGATQLPLLEVTHGLGTGGAVHLGMAAVRASERALRSALAGSPVTLVVAGLAGGTGGGAGPEVAALARRAGSFTVGFGIRPFAFEVHLRQRAAARAALALEAACDLCVTLDNDRALAVTGRDVGLDVALRVADDLVRQAVQGLGGLLSGHGWIPVDLGHVRALMSEGGAAYLALGVGRGATPARSAMVAALSSPLADQQALADAHAVVVQVTGGPDLAVADTAEAVGLLQRRLPGQCELAVGAGCDQSLAGAAQVMVLAAGDEAARLPIPWPKAPGLQWAEAPGGLMREVV